jgi:hypothetical protein
MPRQRKRTGGSSPCIGVQRSWDCRTDADDPQLPALRPGLRSAVDLVPWDCSVQWWRARSPSITRGCGVFDQPYRRSNAMESVRSRKSASRLVPVAETGIARSPSSEPWMSNSAWQRLSRSGAGRPAGGAAGAQPAAQSLAPGHGAGDAGAPGTLPAGCTAGLSQPHRLADRVSPASRFLYCV